MQSHFLAAARGRHVALVFLLGLLLWLGLTASVEPAELTAGVLVAASVAALAADRAPLLAGIRLQASAPWHLVRYLGVFLLALVRANIDMARRVLSPSLPIRPGLVRVRTTLQSDLGRLVLANSITLTPGTLTVDVEGEMLLVHWIDRPPDVDIETATSRIAAQFERHLGGFLY